VRRPEQSRRRGSRPGTHLRPGVSEGDAKLLAEAFNIKTIGDLGRNKFFRAATALVDLADSAK